MKKTATIAIVLLISISAFAQRQVGIVSSPEGCRLMVDDKPLFLNGMNWDYFPVGTNYAYDLWQQPEDVILAALDNEMTLLKNMGVNVIRQYSHIPPRWITYIYEKYGIYTMLNHSFGRYGMIIDGVAFPHTDYANPEMGKRLLNEIRDLAMTYKNTQGLLLYLLGNENNYGLFWKGAETEDIPVDESTMNSRARAMYKLFNEATKIIKNTDPSRPVAICNGDLVFLDIIIEECKDIDIFGVNSYRGDSFDTLFKVVKEKYGKPLLFTEFGSDAYNSVMKKEAQKEQAAILLNNWEEIYLNAAGLGLSGNCIGGFTFQFSDGWWKSDQEKNLDVHDTHASWANGGYKFDFVRGEKNMNEEWFGICAKGMPNDKGLYELRPRTAYKVLGEVHRINPYQSTVREIEGLFSKVRNNIIYNNRYNE